jgi:iron complex outermembrane recepter protein
MGDHSRHRSTDIATVVSAILRAFSICGPVAFFNVPPAPAQSFEPAALAADIPAQPLAQALVTFARQTGVQLVYVSSLVRNRRSHAAPSGLSPDEALARLLQGTGLRFEYLTPHSIRILASATPPRQRMINGPVPDELQEVMVTANRREEDLQDVPIAIQVLTGDTLAKLNATTFDDFVSYLPAVTAHGVGPGQNNLYVRGLGTAATGVEGGADIGGFPNVAVYLDEQSAQLANRNLDIYTADLEHIEILEGPQGTLFGAGAQAGVVRYITNKPKLNVTEATVNAGYATTAHGAQSSNADATLNIPIVTDRLAVRGVIYNERRGGYIDNLPAVFTRADTDLGIHYADAGGKVPANSVSIDNFHIAGRNQNPATYQGIRVEALYQFNHDWNALLSQSYQDIQTGGVFAEMAVNSLGEQQPDLSAQLYNPSYSKDRFENTALTIEGRVAALKLIYAGAYLVRNIEQVQDYTNYARSAFGDFYQCANPTPQTPATAQCFTPSSTWRNLERNTHQTHELRLSTPGDWRIRGVGGLFFENYRIQNQIDFFYLTALPYFHPIGPPTGYYALHGSALLPDGTLVGSDTPGAVFVSAPVTSNNPHIRPLTDAFFDDITRGYKQQAVYTSIDFDVIPNKLTLTAGTRYSHTDTLEVGSTVGSFGCQLIVNPSAPDPCVNYGEFISINSEGLHRTSSTLSSRANLSWKVTEDALLYYTWSQGFRAGGFNRTSYICGCNSPLDAGDNPWQAQAKAHGGWRSPLAFAPDSLVNNELGWKTILGDRRVQWSGAVYQEDWNQVQIALSPTGVNGSLGQTVNGGNYRVRGIETFGMVRITNGLSVQVGAAWNHSELVKHAIFRWADGTPIDFDALLRSNGQKVAQPDGTIGSPLAGAPPFRGNIRVRYEFAFNGYDAFAQFGAVHQSHSLATTDLSSVDLQGKSTVYDLPAFTTYDGAFGVGQDGWFVQAYAENLTDTRAQLFANYAQWYKGITVNRPRTIGVRLSYRFRSS